MPRDLLTLTVSPRLARHLFFKDCEHQKHTGKKVWDTPEIFDFSSWLKSQWMESWPDSFILSEFQSQKIWEGIIEDDPECIQSRKQRGVRRQWSLLHRNAAAQSAARAYGLIKKYKLEIVPESLALTHESRLFLGWLRRYKKRLQEYGVFDPADLIDAVREGMKQRRIPLPEKILLRGFAEVTPQLETWLDFLKSKKVQVTLAPDPRNTPLPNFDELTRNKNIQLHSFSDSREETIQCARWIRSVFKPGQSVGVVVPELTKYRQTILNELSAELVPQSAYPWTHHELPFDISLGPPLANEPLVQTALHLLSIQKSTVSLSTFLYILKSPYLSSGRNNFEARNNLEVRLQSDNFTSIYIDHIESLYEREKYPELYELTSEWGRFLEDTHSHLPSAWAKTFSNFLRKLGWPHEENRTLTSEEVQCLQKWNECLDDMASLDSIVGKLKREQAAEELHKVAQRIPFQVKTKEASILVTDLEQSVGIKFDHLWVVGCHNDCFPAQPAPNPFLPLSLQKSKRLPHADPERELEFAEQSLCRLIKSSGNIVISFPRKSLLGDKDELKSSPLLGRLSVKETKRTAEKSHRIKDSLLPNAQLESWKDSDRIPTNLQENRKFTIQGLSAGYTVLKNQSECPFRAFTAHRLHAEVVNLALVDFDSRERGILIHKALDLFWSDHKTSEKLKELTNENKLSHELARCVRSAMLDSGGRLFRQPRFSKLEEERSVQLLGEWMAEELQRPDFEVKHSEKNASITLSGLKLNLRIDRIDSNPDDSILLIDYKTGQIKPGHWFGERIQEPQLPLYACKMKPQGIAFAGIDKGKIQWRSIVNQESYLSPLGKPPKRIPEETEWPDWKKLLDYWKAKLSKLAEEFINGRLSIDPLKSGNVCRVCGYHSLCRIGENKTDEEIEGTD